MRTLLALLALSLTSMPALAGPHRDFDRPGPPRHAEGPQEPLPPEMRREIQEREAEILEMVREHHPEKLDDLARLKRERPGAYVMALAKVYKHMRYLQDDPEARERMEEIRALRERLHDMRDRWFDLDGKEAKALRAEMETLGLELFDLKQEERRQRLAHMTKRIEELQAEIDEQAASREDIVRKHLDQALSEGDER